MNNLRYRKIRFKELDKGSDQKYFDKNYPEKINTSLGLVGDLNTGRLKLAEDFATFNVANIDVYDYHNNVSCIHYVDSVEYIYHLVKDVTDSRVEIWRQSTYAAPVSYANFAADSKNPFMFISYNGCLLGWYQKFDSSNWISKSDDDGATSFQTAWSYGPPLGYKVAENGYLYIYTKTCIAVCTDGVGTTWSTYFTASANTVIIGFDEMDGEFYAIIRTDTYSDFYHFVKFDDDDNTIIIRTFYSQEDISMKAFNGNIYLSIYVNDVIDFYTWDKSELKKQMFLAFDSMERMKFLNADSDFLIFYCCTASQREGTLIKINIKNGLFPIKEVDVGTGSNCHMLGAVKFKGNLCFTFWDEDDNKFYLLMHRNDASETKQATGKYYTPVIDVGKHIPTYLIVKHKPLGDDASVVVKAKSDQGVSFSVSCINNITNDSVYKMAVLKDLLNEVDFIEFEVTLADSGLGGEIEDSEVIYIYQPTGLENSK